MMTSLAIFSCFLALVPAVLFVRNFFVYLPLPAPDGSNPKLSVLIPARNEEKTIRLSVLSVLRSRDVDLEVIVLDDNSSDRTAKIVESLQLNDDRVRLIRGSALPSGWCGKNFASHQLVQASLHPTLVFLDADVRITDPAALARLAAFLDGSGAALVSGIPRERTGSFSEKLIIPLIHFVLLGFLPIRQMRKSCDPSFGAACGQVMAIRREAYEQSGGYAAIRGRIHDAVALTREVRKAGFATDLFDATDCFQCRMYRSAREVWQGFAKNAHEGLATPRLIVPMTVLLMGGQVFPFLLLAFPMGSVGTVCAVIAAIAAYLPRILGVSRFQQSVLGALLHPVGIAIWVAIQWYAWFRRLCRRPANWKGRSYSTLQST
jgi:hypothetical protein